MTGTVEVKTSDVANSTFSIAVLRCDHDTHRDASKSHTLAATLSISTPVATIGLRCHGVS